MTDTTELRALVAKAIGALLDDEGDPLNEHFTREELNRIADAALIASREAKPLGGDACCDCRRFGYAWHDVDCANAPLGDDAGLVERVRDAMISTLLLDKRDKTIADVEALAVAAIEASGLATLTRANAVLIRERDGLAAALRPFAEVAEWAKRNGHDLHDFDMLLRHIAGERSGHFAGHLQVQADDFLAALSAISDVGVGHG